MAVVLSFIVFTAAMVLCLAKNISILVALLLGFLCFAAAGIKNGTSIKNIISMATVGAKDSLVVIKILFLIGMITALWRSSGTITFFIYYGVKIITPPLFLLIAFALSCILSYALGTSFGVAGTVGIVFMALARSGGVDPVLTAGVIMSGIYFGDRGSPVSSSANLVAAVTHTDIYDNVRVMMKTALIPLLITTGIYAVCSVKNPIGQVDTAVMDALSHDFHISFWLILPAVLMLILPLFKINVMITMTTSIISSFILTVVIQNKSVLQTATYCLTGYRTENTSLGYILNGGGITSMVAVCGIVLISCSYSGIFSGTGMLKDIQVFLEKITKKFGGFVAMIIVSIITTSVFCNQTVASIMCSDLLGPPYKKAGASRTELAVDIENSCIIISALIPWCIAAAVPLEMLGTGIKSLLYSVFLYLLPLTNLLTKKIFFEKIL